MILRCEGIRRVFASGEADLVVLDDVALELSPGEMVCVVGTSGSGKSTLLQILGLIDTPSAGHIEVDGRDVAALHGSDVDALRCRTLGFVFQFHHLLPEFTALENVILPGRIARKPLGELQQRAKDLLDMVGLSDRSHHRPVELSGGEQQRVAVARSLMNQPKVLLMDEPTGNLDRENGVRLLEILDDLRRVETLSILMVTHNAEIAAKADRVLRLDDGRLSEQDRSADIA